MVIEKVQGRVEVLKISNSLVIGPQRVCRLHGSAALLHREPEPVHSLRQCASARRSAPDRRSNKITKNDKFMTKSNNFCMKFVKNRTKNVIGDRNLNFVMCSSNLIGDHLPDRPTSVLAPNLKQNLFRILD